MAAYFLTEGAARDLREIARYTQRRWGRRQRDHYMGALDQRIRALSERPKSGRPREDIGPGIRSGLYGPHLIVYRILPDGIEIARVLHARMDLPTQFGRE